MGRRPTRALGLLLAGLLVAAMMAPLANAAAAACRRDAPPAAPAHDCCPGQSAPAPAPSRHSAPRCAAGDACCAVGETPAPPVSRQNPGPRATWGELPRDARPDLPAVFTLVAASGESTGHGPPVLALKTDLRI